MPSNLTYEALLVLVHGIVCADPNSCVYDLRSLFSTHGKVVRFKIQDDRDLQYVLRVGDMDFEVYVTIEHNPQQHVNQSVNAKSNLHQSFVQLMTSQYASASNSNHMHGVRSFFFRISKVS